MLDCTCDLSYATAEELVAAVTGIEEELGDARPYMTRAERSDAGRRDSRRIEPRLGAERWSGGNWRNDARRDTAPTNRNIRNDRNVFENRNNYEKKNYALNPEIKMEILKITESKNTGAVKKVNFTEKQLPPASHQGRGGLSCYGCGGPNLRSDFPKEPKQSLNAMQCRDIEVSDSKSEPEMREVAEKVKPKK